MLAGGCASERKEMPVAIDGIIDLSEWDFEKDGIVELKGEWRFVWEEFVEPMPSAAFREKYRGTVEVPLNSWLDVPHPSREGEFLPGQGYATYVLEIKLPPNLRGSGLGFAARHQGTSAQYFILETQFPTTLAKVSQGRPGLSKESTIPVYVNLLTEFRVQSEQNIQVWMLVSNFHAYQGGNWNIPSLGFKDTISQNSIFKHGLNAVTLGIVLIISLYHFVLFWQRREDRSSLLFGCLCLDVAVRQWTTGRFSQAMGFGHSVADYQLLLTFEYLSMPLGIITLAAFLHVLVPGPRFLMFIRVWVIGMGVPCILLMAFTSPMIFPKYLSGYQLYLFIASAGAICHLLTKAIQGNSVARWVFSSVIAAIAGVFHDIFVSQGLLENPYISPYTFTAVILMQSGILSGRSARAHRQAEHLSAKLQKDVQEQSRDLNLKTREAQEATVLAIEANAELKQVNARELSHANNLLVQSEKLSQLGTMVAGIGHEIANPIGLISMSAENCSHTTDKLEKTVMPVFAGSEEAEEVGQKIQTIIDDLREINGSTSIGSNRLKDLSMALRTQSRMDLEATPGVNLNPVVKEALVITGGRTKAHTVSESLGELPNLTCYRSKIGQVLTNLLANAADALTEKVDLVRAAGGSAFQGHIFVESKSATHEGKTGVLVAVCDNGDGVPEGIRKKIFDQFYTTKPAGVGTGLGLAMCVDIVKEHGGVLRVTDDPVLGGARFELWLPVELEPGTTEVLSE